MFKVARVVNIYIFLWTDFIMILWFDNIMILWFDNTKYYETPYISLDKALLLSRNKVIRLENWNLWQAPSTIEFNIFCWNFACIPTYQSLQKGIRDIFILFWSWVICKNKKWTGFYTLIFYIFINNSRSKQNKKKSSAPFCRHC